MPGSVGRCLVAGVSWLLAVSSTRSAAAEEIVALSDGTPATLQAAVDAAIGATGTTAIVVPAGDWDWGDERVDLLNAEDIVLIGAGSEHSRLYRASACPGGPMVLVDESRNVRIAELAFDGCDGLTERTADGWTQPMGIHLIDVDALRVDHSSFRDFGRAAVRTNGEDGGGSRGVVDHCDFVRMYVPEMEGRYNLGYGVAVSGIGEIEDVSFGSSDATFIEDCTFDRTRHAVAASGGARYVFRHNVVTNNRNSHAVDAHGQESAAPVGTEWAEIYANLVHEPEEPTAAVRIRGGRAIVWDNDIRGYVYAVSLWEETPQDTGPVYIWGNTLGDGVARLGDVRETAGSVEVHYERPAGYEPYAYPHPMVTDLEARAGPDQNPVAVSEDLAPTYLDATQTSASEGSIVAYRWYDGATLVSSCARDVVELGVGTHVLVLAVERSDGLVELDTARVRALGDGPVTSDGTWPNRWFVPILGRGTIEIDATPSTAAMNGYVAFTGRRGVTSHEDNAVIVRFNTGGQIDVYDDGPGYHADRAVTYGPGVPVHLVIEVDVGERRYDVRADGTLIAQGYSFRADVLTVGQMTLWDASGEVSCDGLQVRGELAAPDPACAGTADADADVDADADASTDADADRDRDADGVADAQGDAEPDADTRSNPGGGCGCAAPGSAPSPGAGLRVLLAYLGLAGLTGP